MCPRHMDVFGGGGGGGGVGWGAVVNRIITHTAFLGINGQRSVFDFTHIAIAYFSETT